MRHATSKNLTRALSLSLGIMAACAPFPIDQNDGSQPRGNRTQATHEPALSPPKQMTAKQSPRGNHDVAQDVRRERSGGRAVPGESSVGEPSPLEPIENFDEAAAQESPAEALPSLARPQASARDGKIEPEEVTIAQRPDGRSAGPGHGGATSMIMLPLEDVFFRFNSVTIDDAGKQALNTNAGTVKNARVKRIVVEGHCDERGSAAYNLVLGEKRAAAIEQYFSELGIDPAAVETVSYGKERPFCRERDEACYQQNRRGHIWMEAEASGPLTRLTE